MFRVNMVDQDKGYLQIQISQCIQAVFSDMSNVPQASGVGTFEDNLCYSYTKTYLVGSH